MSSALRILFAGTPDFAATSLAALLNTEHQVVGVYTQPDRPSGRGRKLTPSPVKALALEHGIEVMQPTSLKDSDAQAALAAFNADIMVVVAYGLLLPKAVLDTPRLGCINIHGSLLPRWRGAAPIHRAVLAGDNKTGITIMQMDEGLDTGDMLHIRECDITPDMTSGQLHDQLAELGATSVVEALTQIANGEAVATPQPEEGTTYAHKLTKEEGQMDWTLSAEALQRKVKGLSPWPVAYTSIGDKTLRVWDAEVASTSSSAQPGEVVSLDDQRIQVACGEGVLSLTYIQLPGSKAMASDQVLNAKAAMFAPGTRLGSL